jgi:hypothetical protein
VPAVQKKPRTKPLTLREFDAELVQDMARFEMDPLGFVLYAFPWGQPGSLKDKKPRRWFAELCGRIREKLLANLEREAWEIVQEAVASGHGIGKSAGFAQLILWAMSTREHTRGVVTANTDTQLRTKTWPEVVKWHGMAINRHWFECTATAIYHKQHEKTWRIDAIPWSAHNTEAFAGLHNLGNRLLLVFDEASAIADPVWETAEGALTDEKTQILWLVAGNPTRATGRFRQCFSRFRHRWGTRNIDSRTVEGTNKAQIERWARDYGEHSQFFCVRVKGEFVEADANQLIPLQWISDARIRQWNWEVGDGSQPKLRVSVDVADGGEDETVITVARHYQSAIVILRQQSFSFQPSVAPIESALAAERMFLEWGGRPDYDDFVVDAIGVGAGCAGTLIAGKDERMAIARDERLKGKHYQVVQYKGGAESADPKKWRNRRVQSYIALRNAFRDGTIILHPETVHDELAWDEFEAQLTSVKTKPGVEKLEDLVTKEDMKRDGLKSPDRADSLAMQLATIAPTIGSTQGDGSAAPILVSRSNLWEGYAG